MNDSSTIPCPLAENAKRIPNNAAILWSSRQISWKDLNQYVEFSCRALKKQGVQEGDRICVAENYSVEMIIIMLALWRLGAIACPMNPKIPQAMLQEMIQKIQGKILLSASGEILDGKKFSVPVFPLHDFIQFDQKDSFFDDEKNKNQKLDLNQEALIIWTSGSSGEPKPALLTFGNLYFNAQGLLKEIPLKEVDRWLLCLPLFHVAGIGIVMRTLIAGATIVILSKEENLAGALEKYSITHVSLVTTQLKRLVESPALSAKALKVVLLGGSSFQKSLLKEAHAKNFPIYVSYGLTEMASTVAMGKCDSDGNFCARVLQERELKIAEDGEILVRGRSLFKGYLLGQKVRQSLNDEGWFPTGDLGKIDKGCLSVSGRRDRMFISGGENIQPEEIEKVLCSISGIQDAVVVPVKDEKFGQRPAAFLRFSLVPTSCADIKVKPIQNLLAQSLPAFKIPIQFYQWPSQEDASSLKLNRTRFIKLLEMPSQLKSLD